MTPIAHGPADLDQLARLDGLITPAVGALLYQHATQIPAAHAVVEVGAWRGQSSCYLAAGARDGHGPPVFSVDPWDGNPGWCRHCEQATLDEWDYQVTYAGLRQWVQPARGRSVDIAALYTGPPVGLLYVDGDHHHDAVIADVLAWWPHLDPAATIVFDDYLETVNPGVGTAVMELRVAGVLDPAIGVVARCAIATLRGRS